VQIICYEREALAVSVTDLLDLWLAPSETLSLIEDLHVGRETRDSRIGSAMSWKSDEPGVHSRLRAGCSLLSQGLGLRLVWVVAYAAGPSPRL